MVTINRIEQLAKEHPAKMSQAERRMRELCHGEEAKIKPIFHEKGYIGGYIFKSEPKQVKLL